MPIDTNAFSSSLSAEPTKTEQLSITSSSKRQSLANTLTSKRESMMSPTEAAINALYQAAATTTPDAFEPLAPTETLASAAVRGAKGALIGVPMLATGLVAGASAIAESKFGEGGWASDLKDSAVWHYQDFERQMNRDAMPEDSFTYAYDAAQKGNLGALVSWATHGTGYVAAQLATMLTGVGLAEKGVELTGKKAVAKVMKGLVDREAKRIAGAEAVSAEMIAQATSTVARKLGQHIGMAGFGFGMEGGEIGGDLAGQSVERGTPLTDKEIAKGIVGTGAAGAVEYLETVLGLKAITGKLSKIPGAKVDTIGGAAGRATRAGATAAKIAPAEAAQEFTQTGIEQWATGKDLSSEESKLERVDAAAMGALMAGPGAAGASLKGSVKERGVKAENAATKRLVQAESQPGYTDKVKDIAEGKVDASEYSDIDAPGYNPVVATEGLRAKNNKESTSAVDRNSNYNQAVQISSDVRKKQEELVKQLESKDPKIQEAATKQFDRLAAIQERLIPSIQAMGKGGVITPELKTQLQEAKDAAGIRDAVYSILGSRSSGRDIDLGSIPKEVELDPKTEQLVSNIQDLKDSDQALTDHGTNTKTVTENIFEGTDGQKGINNYISAITNGDSATQQKELEQLLAFAERKQKRATDFRNALDGKAELSAEYKQKDGKPYDITPAFEQSVVAMELEAKALQDAVVLGSTIAGVPIPSSIPKPVTTKVEETAPSVKKEVPPTRKVAPRTAVKEAGQVASKESPSTKTSAVAEQKDGDTTVTLEDMSVEELRVAYRKATTQETKDKIASIARSKKAGTFKPEDKDTVKPNAKITVPKHFTQAKGKSVFQTIIGLVEDLRTVASSNKEATLLDSMVSFGSKLSEAINTIYKHEPKEYQHLYPHTQLAVNDILPQKVNDAIAAVSYKWLATRGAETHFNKDSDIMGILSLDKEQDPIPAARMHIAKLGSSAATLSSSLGREIASLLGLKAEGTAQAQEQERLEVSLGLMALASMQKMGMVTRNTISREAFKNLIAATKAGDTSFKMTAKEFAPVSGQGNIKFFRVNEKKISNIQKKYKASKSTWESIFTGEPTTSDYSWQKIKAPKQEQLRKSKQKATVKQTKNKNDNVNRPFILAGRTMNMFAFLDKGSRGKVMGMLPTINKHEDLIKGVTSTNVSLERSYNQVLNWLVDAEDHGGNTTEFFIPAYFGANGRMYQEGSIQPQGSKVQRYLFSMAEWSGEIDPKDEAQTALFMEAVGQSLGIEASKMPSLEATLEATRKKLKLPEIVAALKAMDNVLTEVGDIDTHDAECVAEVAALHPEWAADIATGVEAAGEKVHSLKGLMEYQRFLLAQAAEQPFTTDLTIEIDGKANGPIISSIQLRLSEMTPEQLGIYISGGLSFTDAAAEGDHNITHDPYQSIGAEWGNFMARIKEIVIRGAALAKKGTNKKIHIDELKRIEAAEALLGPLFDEHGDIAGITRKLAKNRSVGALYGAGEKKVILGLLNDVFIKDTIQGKLEKLALDIDKNQDEIISLLRNVNIMSGTKAFGSKLYGSDGKISRKTILELKIPKEVSDGIHKHLKEYHGRALFQAIEKVYGDTIDARKPLNEAITIAVGYYNTAHDYLIKKHFEKHSEITVDQLAAIRKELQPLFPRVKTPFDGGYIEVAEFERNKAYDEKEKLRVTQKYNVGHGVTVLTGYPHEIAGLAAPGVKPVVTMVHMLDSIIANRLLGNTKDMGVLNVHDGFLIGLHQMATANTLANKHFYEVMDEYSISGAIQESFNTTRKEFQKLGLPQSLVKELTENFRKLKLTSKKANTAPKVREANIAAVNKVKEAAEKNKAEILNATTNVNQYYASSGGAPTGNTQKEAVGGIPTEAIVTLVESGIKAIAQANRTLTEKTKATIKSVKEEIQGSRVGPMSTNTAEYAVERQINKQNVSQTYDQIKKDSVVVDSAAHDATLKSLLTSLVQNVMNPVDMFLKTNPEDETHGQLKTDEAGKQQLFISSQVAMYGPVSGALASGIRMSTGEVYVHELIHAIIDTGKDMNKQLRRQIEALYDIAREALDYKAFLNDPTIDVNDPANFYDVKAAKDRFNYVFRGDSVTKESYTDSITGVHHTSVKSNHLTEFIALGLTNENFSKALIGVSLNKLKQRILTKSTWSGIVGSNLQKTIINIFSKIMEIIHEKFDKGIPENNVGAELERLTRLLVKIDSKNKTRVYNTITKVDARYKQLADKANQLIKQAFKTTPVLKTAHGLKVGMQQARKSESPLGDALRSVEYKIKTLDYGLTKSIITEIRGNTPRMNWLHKLLHRRKVFLDSSKEAVMAYTKKTAAEGFKRELTIDEKTTLLKAGMKTDLSYLTDHMKFSEILSLVQDPKALSKKIDSINKEIKADPNLKQYATYYDQSSNALGYFMVTGRFRAKENTFPSTKVIADLLNTKHQGSITTKQAKIADVYVNQLASLYALKYTSKERLSTLSDLMVEDPEGVTRFFSLHKELKKDSLKYAFNGNSYQFIKGYTKEILNPRIEYKLGIKSDEKELAEQGFKRSIEPIERDSADPMKHVDIYAYTADTGRVNDFLSQILSLTGNRGKGSDTSRLAQQMGHTTKTGAVNNIKIINLKQLELDAMFSPSATSKPGGNYMIPQVDAEGMITKYRYMMAESTKDDYLDKMNEFDTVMGAMAGQIIDKARTPIINEELVDGLKAMYDKEYDSNPEAYLEVGPHSADPKLREIYYMLPAKTRAYVQHRWGSPTMFVAKDVLTIAFGYRKYSIVQAFAKTPAERHKLESLVVGFANLIFKQYGIKAANNTELVMTALTKLAKNNIIVKALTVTLNNFGSNLMYLRAKGIPVSQILKKGWIALNQGLKYQDDKQQLDQAKLELKLLTDPAEIKKAELHIIKLNDKIARNPVTKAMEAGLLPSIVDDVETDVTQNNFPSKTEKFITSVTDKLPAPVVNVGKVLLLTQDTDEYRILNNAVKMTDFVGRYILYEEYMKEAAKAPEYNQDKAHAESILKVMEEFVNFDLPTHKTVEYLNQIGLIWFSKYVLRIQKIIMKGLLDRPFDAAASLLLSSSLGLDNIGNSLVGVTKDLTNNLGDPINMFMDSIDKILPVSMIKSLFNK